MFSLPRTWKKWTGRGKQDDKQLCSNCQAIFDKWYERDNWKAARPRHSHHTVVGLRQSANEGCPICTLLLRSLDDDATQLLQQSRPDLKGLISVEIKSQEHYTIKIVFGGEGDDLPVRLGRSWVPTIEVYPSGRYTFKPSDPIANRLKVSNESGTIRDVVDCEENWALVTKWLKTCQETHNECAQRPFDWQLPTRLIDVGISDADLRLCHSTSLPQETQYLTLSHCWGGKVFTTLTRSNFQDFFSNIPAGNLSKTFKEAIATTRNLGFRCIWIDSLCIVQGDEVDWQYEASRMGAVYANSALNIAAAAAPNGDFGCFSARTPGEIYGCKVATRTRRHSSHTTLWDCCVHAFTWKSIHNNVLSSRAWVFQECFLAPRSLHFTASQLFWECRSSRACETFPGSYDDESMTQPALSTSSQWNDPATDIAYKWSSVVAEYSERSVTFSTDKLVALSGVARLFAARFGTTYLAGMWKEDLVKQLAWRTYGPSQTDATRSIPSWSWAAINNGIGYEIDDESYISLVSILEATTIVANDNFGDVKTGNIRMQCRLPCTYSIVKQATLNIFGINSGSHTLTCKLHPDTTPYSVGDDVYLLALLRYTLMGGKMDGVEMLCGLIIEPVHPASYRRTGYFSLFDDDIQHFITEQEKATSMGKYFIGEYLGPNENGHKMCIITIV